jgi:hypothetical protein
MGLKQQPQCLVERVVKDILILHLRRIGKDGALGTNDLLGAGSGGGAESGGGAGAGACESSTEIVGAEFWFQSRRADGPIEEQSITIHWDKDEALRESTGTFKHPVVATVTYLSGAAAGIPTVIFDRRVTHDGHLVQCKSGVERCLEQGRGGHQQEQKFENKEMGKMEEGKASLASAATTTAPTGFDPVFVSYPKPGKHLAFDGGLLHGCPAELAAERDFGVRRTLMVNVWKGHRPIGIKTLPIATEGEAKELLFSDYVSSKGGCSSDSNAVRIFELHDAVPFETLAASGCALQALAEHSAPLTPEIPLVQLRANALSRGVHAIEVRHRLQ